MFITSVVVQLLPQQLKISRLMPMLLQAISVIPLPQQCHENVFPMLHQLVLK